MPKEKSLFFIGVWIILLAYFIGLPTEIKNIVFLATGLLIIAISYGSYFSNIKNSGYFSKKEESPREKVENPEIKKRIIPKFKFKKPIEEIDAEDFKIKKEIIRTEEQEEIVEEKPNFDQYESVIKVRKSRTRKPKVIREESIIMQDEDDTDDVIVISSDGDN